MLVFFDVLSLDGQNLTGESYEMRRDQLERLVRIIPGFAVLAERVKIRVRDADAHIQLQTVFARHIVDYEGWFAKLPLRYLDADADDAFYLLQRAWSLSQGLRRTKRWCRRCDGLRLDFLCWLYSQAEALNKGKQLKKDYVKGLGDTLDLAVFGASWNKERGRELRGERRSLGR